MGCLGWRQGNEQGGGDAGKPRLAVAPACAATDAGGVPTHIAAVLTATPPLIPSPHPAPALLLPPPSPLLQKYIDLVAEGNADWEGHEAFENYTEEEEAQ